MASSSRRTGANNLVAFARTGQSVTGCSAFLDPKAASRLAAFVAGLPGGTVVAAR
jgi:hypothetical protein